jgi:syntaxin 1B/2/3
MGYGANPYDQREDGGAPGAQDPRFNNYAQGRYDDRKWACFPRRCSD